MPGFKNFEVVFGADMAGLRPFTASDGPIPTGVFKVQFIGADLVNKKKDEKTGTTPPGKNIEIEMKVIEGFVREAEARNVNVASHYGREIRKWIVAPGTGGLNKKGESTDEMGAQQLRALLESIGHAADQIDQIKADQKFQVGMLVQFDAQNQLVRDAQGNIVGRFAYVHNVETNQTQNGRTEFITPEKYELYRQGAWTPNEVGEPRQPRAGGTGGNLPNVGTMPNTASAVQGLNPTAVGAGTAPAPALGNPGFAQQGAGTQPVVPTAPANGGGSGIGGMIR